MAHKEDNKYYVARNKTGLSVDKAIDELFDVPFSRNRLYRIEEESTPHPDEVCAMAKAYKCPELTN